MTDRAHNTASGISALGTKSLLTREMGTAEGTNVFADIVVTNFTEIGIGINLRTTIRTTGLTNGFSRLRLGLG